MHARSALFDLWGDHLRSRGGRAPVAALIRLLAALGISEPAVRTAVSRMVRQGWLEPARTPGGPGYALTDRARDRLDGAAHRIYRTADIDRWDGHWHIVVLPRVPSRSRRDRVRAALGFLGYAPLQGDTWIAPRRSPDLTASLAAEDLRAYGFDAVPDTVSPAYAHADAHAGWHGRSHADSHTGSHGGAAGDPRPAALARTVWDLDALGAAYQHWQSETASWVARADSQAGDKEQFAARSRLVHEWRKFLFTDPGLPAQLLPDDWSGGAAAALFDRESARLAPAASRFVDSCLRTDTTHD